MNSIQDIAGINGSSIIWDGCIHRFSPSNEKGKSKHAWYVGHTMSGSRRILIYGSWRDGSGSYSIWRSWSGNADGNTMSDDEIKLMNEARDREKIRIKEARMKAAMIAKTVFNVLAKPVGDSEYLQRKNISNAGFKFITTNSRVLGFDKSWMISSGLFVPIYNKKGDIVNAQIITGKSKLFLPGGEVSGCYGVIKAGKSPLYDYKIICEGVATGITLSMVTQCTIIISFTAGNIVGAMKAAKHVAEDKPFLIAGDNDRETEENTGKNTGRVHAINASIQAGGTPYVIPVAEDIGITDFNDLYVSKGADELKRQLSESLKLNTSQPDTDHAIKKPDISEIDNIDILSEYFTMIHGTESAWDGIHDRVIKLSALNKSAPNHYKIWAHMTGRKIIDADKIVFDPGNLVESPKINLFRGLADLGKPGKFDRIMDLLAHTMNHDPIMINWQIDSLAFMIQNLGQKMDSSMIVHGVEGCGKNMFYEKIVCAIFAPYSNVISQSQIESSFNEWASNKLFTLMDEVNCCGNRRVADKLKVLITGTDYIINAKGITEKTFKACSNFALLSNERQPVPISLNDRRYAVSYIETPLSQQLADAVELEIYNGGLAGFKEYLISKNINHMRRQSSPPYNQAKNNLQKISMDSCQKFMSDMASKDLSICKDVIIATDTLFMYYKAWCKINNLKPSTNNTFMFDLKKSPFINIMKYKGREYIMMTDKIKPDDDRRIHICGGINDYLDDVHLRVSIIAKEYGVIR